MPYTNQYFPIVLGKEGNRKVWAGAPQRRDGGHLGKSLLRLQNARHAAESGLYLKLIRLRILPVIACVHKDRNIHIVGMSQPGCTSSTFSSLFGQTRESIMLPPSLNATTILLQQCSQSFHSQKTDLVIRFCSSCSTRQQHHEKATDCGGLAKAFRQKRCAFFVVEYEIRNRK